MPKAKASAKTGDPKQQPREKKQKPQPESARDSLEEFGVTIQGYLKRALEAADEFTEKLERKNLRGL